MLIGFGIVSSFSLVAAAAGLAWGLQHYKEITFIGVPTVEAAPPGEPVNWLLVGSDSREGIDPNDPNAGVFLGEEVSGKRTDTIMLARVDPVTKTVDLLSVPRDLWVPISGTGKMGRVNSAFNGDGGEERLVSTVEDVLGIDINNYVEINFVGFQSIIDSLGGIPVWFDFPVRDTNSGLDVAEAGCQTLGGFEALAFARSRHLEYFEKGKWKDDITGDLGRNTRQQYLITRLADISKNHLDLTNLGTIDNILTVGGRNLLIDDGASAKELFILARTFSGVGGEGIRSHALPVAGFETSGGAQVLDLLEDEAQPTLDVFRGLSPLDPTVPPSTEVVPRDSFTIDVRNGARIARLATNSKLELEKAGFVVGKIGDAAESVEHTVVRYPSNLAAGASVLGTSLATSPLYKLDSKLTTVELVLGPDYTGLSTGPAGTTSLPATTTTTTTPPPIENENVVGIVPGPGPAGTACAA